MSINAQLVITTQPTAFPEGVTPGLYRFTILSPDGTTELASAVDPSPSHTFSSLALDPGAYVIKGERLDAAGNPVVGLTVATGVLDVPVQVITAEAPVTITGSLV